MIVRIVHLTFNPGDVTKFLSVFDESADQIRSADGCRHVELLRSAQFDNMFTTYSLWDSEDHLNRYRSSDLFKQVWDQTKVLFAAPPAACSYESIRILD